MRLSLATVCLVCCGLSAAVSADARNIRPRQPTSEEIEFFEKKIRPVLVSRCYPCHSENAQPLQGGLLLDSRDGVRRGGDSGAAIVPGNPDESLLLDAIQYNGLEMPPDAKLPQPVIADFAHWIEMGAPDPRDAPTSAFEPDGIDFAKARQFWAFQTPRRHPSPDVQRHEWINRPLDAFVLARLEANQLSPSAAATRRTLIRRLTFDLTGLPPTPDEVDQFLHDDSENAYAALVERLLASPHYGERWARMWLDVARYAEDQAHIVGNDRSLFYPNAYLYRDWVIGALNEDVPYDEFVKLQLAADLTDPDDQRDRPALGFVGLGPKYYSRRSLDVMCDEWEDRVDTVSRGLLGLTVACARCHDHKYDPIETEDFYALAGVFASTEMFNRPLDDTVAKKKDGQAKDPEDALHIIRDAKPTDLTVFIRGDVKSRGPIVKRRFLTVLCHDLPPAFRQGSGRLELAAAIVSRDNPLTARVIVNRIWGQLFGRYLVMTPSNFGAVGQRPTHPELLDDLAVRLMDNGWSLKWLIREIVSSATYRQSSHTDAQKESVDPANTLLGRMNRRRLSVEMWRDAILSAGGTLDGNVGGKSIDPADPTQTRRTIYSRISRLDLNKMLALFDFPDPNAHAARRTETTTPLQKLFVLNNPFMVQQADTLVARLAKKAGNNDHARIRLAYDLLFSRPPTDDEQRWALSFLGPETEKEKRDAQWSQYVQVLLASNELLYLD